MSWLEWESGVLRLLCEVEVSFYGRSELYSRSVFLAGKLRFSEVAGRFGRLSGMPGDPWM